MAIEAKKFQDLIQEVAAKPKNSAAQNFIKVQPGASMNYGFYEYYREEDIPASFSRMVFSLPRFRLAVKTRLARMDSLQSAADIIEPAKLHKITRYAVALLPLHPQSLDAGPVYFVELEEPLDLERSL